MAVNVERAAERARELVRWLRSGFQRPQFCAETYVISATPTGISIADIEAHFAAHGS